MNRSEVDNYHAPAQAYLRANTIVAEIENWREGDESERTADELLRDVFKMIDDMREGGT